MTTLRKWDITNKEAQDKCIDEIITRIAEIDDPETVGVIAAQDIIDIVTERYGPEIYNKAVRDVKKLVFDRLDDIEVDIDALEV